MKTVDEISKKYLCLGCGTCKSICPEQAIELKIRDIYQPQIDKDKCNLCGQCIDVCPGIGISLENMAKDMWPSNLDDFYIGRFIKTYLGYSNDQEIRFNSASGGIATSLVCNMLENKLIDGAILTRMSQVNPFQSESFIAQTKAEVISAQTSKYCPSCPGSVIDQIKQAKADAKYVFVGLPCQVQAIRKYQQIDKSIKNKIILTIGIFCAHAITNSGIDLILKRFARGSKNLKYIKYRGRGWPGGVNVRYQNGEEYFIKHDQYWGVFFAPYFHTPARCLTCYDLTSELADISLGDAWLKEIKMRDQIGTSIIIVRSDIGGEILNAALQKKDIHIEQIKAEKVRQSQQGILTRKKFGTGAMISLFRILGKPTPKYDHEFKFHRINYIGALLAFLNAEISSLKLGKFLLRYIPAKYAKKYNNYVFKLFKKTY